MPGKLQLAVSVASLIFQKKNTVSSEYGPCIIVSTLYIRSQNLFLEGWTPTSPLSNMEVVNFVCLFGLRLNIPVNNFSVMSGHFPGLNQY